MRPLALVTAVISVVSTAVAATESNLTKPLSSQNLLSTFVPPQVFKNANLVRAIHLEKSYAKESINVVIENIDSKPQDEYYIPFTPIQMEKIGGLEVRDRKDAELGLFKAQPVEFDAASETQLYKVTLPRPLQPKSQQTLSISYSYLSSLSPLPANIAQNDQQFLVYDFSAYWPSAYLTVKQKTDVKFPGNNVPEYTIIPSSGSTPESPQKAGSKFTYGPFGEVPAGASETVRVRYEFTHPLIYVSKLERDIEVSHWGGNVAFEERYTLHNKAANLSSPFSRVTWASQQYYSPPTTAIKDLRFPLKVGSLTPYFTDVIGNVSTSRFRSNRREANLELKPRYPIFGGWNYPFRVGWDADIKNFLRRPSSGDRFVLKVPFLEGPKPSEGVAYEHVDVRVILPEGATYVVPGAPFSSAALVPATNTVPPSNVDFYTATPVTSTSISTHKTFMDTLGRTVLTLTARNLVDEMRGSELYVTYDYPFAASLRKPLAIFGLVMALFAAAYTVGKLDVQITGARFAKTT
ncbi:MAG: dolichyl-diphosphooligosaccharide--protein glycosyltransferase subunit 1 [Claussenomyces sp. TS43310]|nr:MAG: dolichyl-diphosphooligosaccharide--protein glycosyltransferase subunit 1 [Claussenomyces sp. TS43310]